MAANKGKGYEVSGFASRKSPNVKTVLQRKEGTDPESKRLLQHIFEDYEEDDDGAVASSDKELGLHNLGSYVESKLTAAELKGDHKASDGEDCNGRLGPEHIVFDILGNSGTLVIEADRLGVASHSNFSTIRANTCVYRGKWVYELMLGSKGVMQVGWATLQCRFTTEEGVGDTPESYAYDGNRLRKWNVRTTKYGQAWLTGDVISCAIDCDIGTISFFRNGQNMGEAFNNVRLGQGVAYFPAVSLSLGENLRANFGATPLRYPLEGYSPLQDPPTFDLVKAQQLFSYLEKLLPVMVEEDRSNGVLEVGRAYFNQDTGSSGRNNGTRFFDHQNGSEVKNIARLCATHEVPLAVGGSPVVTSEFRTRKATLLLIASHLFDKISLYLKNSYIVEACLFRFLLKFCDSQAPLGNQPYIQKLLDLLWALLQEHEIKPCLEHLVVTMLSSYRFSPVRPDFSYQHMYLTVTLAVLQHEATRKYLLKYVLFDKVKFAIFMHVKPPDDAGLAQLIPTVWWGFAKKNLKQGDSHEDLEEGHGRDEASADHGWKPDREKEEKKQQTYLSLCQELGNRVRALEVIQVEILKVLLKNCDQQQGASSRFIFLHKFREFLRENSTMSIRGQTVNQCPLPVSLCFFHRLIQAVRYYWDEFAAQHPGESTCSADAYVPTRRFYDDSIDYFDVQRLGGLLSHLKKCYRDELNQSLTGGHSPQFDTVLAGSDHDEYEEILDHLSRSLPCKLSLSDDTNGSQVSASSLVEMLDGIVLLYNLAAHKQLGKMCSLRENVNEYVAALEDTRKKIALCPPQMGDVLDELRRAEMVFIEKTSEQARHMAWVIAVIYAKVFLDWSAKETYFKEILLKCHNKRILIQGLAAFKGEKGQMLRELANCQQIDYEAGLPASQSGDAGARLNEEKQEDVFWLLDVALRTIEHASSEEKLFSFVPDFYIEVIINSYNALHSHFHPTVPYHSLQGFNDVLLRYATFLSRHFADARIVNTDIRDIIVQALACFVCYRQSLQALESVPQKIQLDMVQALLAPYENRSWAQTNWILVRLWKGCGFAFRYKHLPHVLPAKSQQQEIGCASLQSWSLLCHFCHLETAFPICHQITHCFHEPCPSKVFQDHIQEYLLKSPDAATKLIDSLLNQLNWAFSEFVGMLQELQQIAQRPMASYVDSRQLKICATCFDISVGLLRVLEMIVTLVPQHLVDWSQSSAELLLCRLFQLLTQVLNRVTSRSTMFDMVVSVNMPGLETVDHFPILTAVTGILIALIVNATGKSKERSTGVLLAEPGFQLSTLEFLFGRTSSDAAAVLSDKKIFSLKNYTEVNDHEIALAEALLMHLRQQESMCKAQTPDIEEDMLCNICYARPKLAVFRPCGHQSCKTCITHHLMNRKECFFCKTPIEAVDDALNSRTPPSTST